MDVPTAIDPTASKTVVTVHEAKTHLSRLLARVEAGEEIVIARGSMPVARLVAQRPAAKQRQLGWLKADSRGKDPLAYGFWDPIPDVEMELWNGERDHPDDASAP